MDGAQRRQRILDQLSQTKKPISASRFASELGVSRQVIVGDIALLRAAGEEIVATARGYKQEHLQTKLESKIAVQHQENQTREELETIVSLGGEVLNVIVEHDIYGELIGNLHISELSDVDSFMESYETSNAGLLSQLTDGIHLHTIRYENQEILQAIKDALIEKGILYQD
ncbi:3H domain-containing protein [Enterococcus olivae]